MSDLQAFSVIQCLNVASYADLGGRSSKMFGRRFDSETVGHLKWKRISDNISDHSKLL